MPNPFKDPIKKWPEKFMPATKADVLASERRLRDLILALGDPQRIKALTEQLKQSASALQEAVDKNKP